jgi:CRISPR-associated endonuclease Csn1
MSYTLGLDIGSKSIGWALLSDKPKSSILDIGVRVFPEGVDRDTKGAEKSKNATRREARGARRVHQRRNLRRDKLIQTLRENGLLPVSDKELKNLLSEKDPYQIRARGLDEKLELHEFGRVLFHLNQRRGFKSNRKTGEANEKSKIAKGDKNHKGANEIKNTIKEDKIRTIGEYFAKIGSEKSRIRGHYTFRLMYEMEFDKLWEKQAEFYPDILTEDWRKKIRDEIIFYQRPLKPTDELIGLCDLEPEEKRCPRGDWFARRFRILQDVNNLKIHSPDGTERVLEDDERRIILKELDAHEKVTFSSLRKKLRLLETQEFNAEYEINEKGKKRDKLKGDEFSSAMRSKNLFGAKKWESMDEQEKIELNDDCLELDDDELRAKIIAEYGFSEQQAEKVLKISLPQRYMSFSRKAIQKLLPLMDAGKRTDEALDEVYPDRNKMEEIKEEDKLPLPEDLRNPIVNKALHEVCKVVNAIIREYGKPTKIVIEMARDMKGSSRERKELHFKMLDNEKRNKEVRQKLKNDIGIESNRDNVIKYKLWEECGRVCPYTGKQISQVDLFINPVFQVEHILPYSKSLDDSYLNKTLCCVNENRLKGNQTPYEYYHGNKEKFEEIKQRVNRTAMPYWKKRKFWQEKVDTDKIIERELNDTRYICKEVVKYLKQICRNVTGTRGKVTAELRYQWGFIKVREDHRHHAIDATVVAVTKQKHLRDLARSKYSVESIRFKSPWPNFREELVEKIKHIDVSHRPSKKSSGKLHEETFYGLTKETENFFKKGNFKKEEMRQLSRNAWLSRTKLYYVYSRTPAEILKKVEDIDQITDNAKNVKDAIRKRLIECGVDISNKKTKIPKDLFKETLYLHSDNGKRIPIKKIRVETSESNMIIFTDESGNPYRACPTEKRG